MHDVLWKLRGTRVAETPGRNRDGYHFDTRY
jgi:hypothetical protein